MIIITKEADTAIVQKICANEGVDDTEKVCVFTAKDKEDVLGYSLFVCKDKLYIVNVATSPLLWNSIGDGLFRATLNFAVENGIFSATINETLLEKLKGNIIPVELADPNIENCEKFLQDIKRCGK